MSHVVGIDDDQLFNDQTGDSSQEQGLNDSIIKASVHIKNYSTINFIGFIFACFSAITFVVFLTATQTYFITDVLGISDKLGNYVGTLGFYDELLAICIVPFIGSLSDRIGSRPIQVFGSIIIGVSFYGYATFAKSVYPGMLFWRLIFSVGAASLTSTMTVMLIELNNSNFKMKTKKEVAGEVEPLITAAAAEDDISVNVNEINNAKKDGKMASIMGIASGLGAIFSVSVYLRLPVRFGESEPAKIAMKYSYYLVGTIAFLTAIILAFILYQDDKKIISADDVEESAQDNNDTTTFNKSDGYFHSLKRGVLLSIRNPVILVSYLGSFIARITTIAISVFIPFYINNYFFKSGKCSTKETDKLHCRESYILSSILTGISQTCALLAAPFIGILIDKVNNHAHLLLVSNVISMISAIGMTRISQPDESKIIFLWVAILGVTQISFILISMTILSNINSNAKYYNYKGSISGVYSLFGGVGILFMNKLGGIFGDLFISGPFVILICCNLIFLIFMFLLKGAKENDERTFQDVFDNFKRMVMISR